jgi:short-subunit dehydrogenase
MNGIWTQHTHYTNTKLGCIYFTQYLTEYLNKNHPHIKTICVNPGLVYTNIGRFIMDHKWIGTIYHYFFFTYLYIAKSALAGAQTVLHTCYLDWKDITSSGYYSDNELKTVSKLAMNKEMRDNFMRICLDVLRKYDGFENLFK